MFKIVFKTLENGLIASRSSGLTLDTGLGMKIVRWRRKPRWLPTAKSKLYRIPKRPQIPHEEAEELKKLHNHYRTEMKSLRAFFMEKLRKTSTGVEALAEQKKIEEEEHEISKQINEEWNLRIAVERERKLQSDKENELEQIIETMEKNKLLLEEEKQRANELVRQEKEYSKSYITAENIDEAIDKALNDLVDYNFAIDVEENIYKGRRAKPEAQSKIDEDNFKTAASG